MSTTEGIRKLDINKLDQKRASKVNINEALVNEEVTDTAAKIDAKCVAKV